MQVLIGYYLTWDLKQIDDILCWFWKCLSTILKCLKCLTLLKSSIVSILYSLYCNFKDLDWFANKILSKTEIALAIIPQSIWYQLCKANQNNFSTILKCLSHAKPNDLQETLQTSLDVIWPSPLTRKPSSHKIAWPSNPVSRKSNTPIVISCFPKKQWCLLLFVKSVMWLNGNSTKYLKWNKEHVYVYSHLRL